MNQTRKNVRSTKTNPLETAHNNQLLRGQKKRDVYTKVYDVRETIFSEQTAQFPTRSQSGNKYIIIMMEIDSSGILVKPMSSRKDSEMILAYKNMMQRLKQANIQPSKHVLDNEISAKLQSCTR